MRSISELSIRLSSNSFRY